MLLMMSSRCADQCKDDDSFDGDTYLDEEATLHTATESSLVRITARMVKMIDIKPSKATSSVEGRRFNPSQTDLNNIFSFRDENLLPPPPPTSSPKSSLPPSLASFVFPARGDSLRGHADDQNPDDIVVQEASGLTPSKTHSKHVLHDKKQIKSTPISPVPKEGSAMRAFERQKIITPSEVSRPNLEAWFYTTDLAATKHERPYSVLDPDVVSDRLLDRPPSPPPKHDPFRNLCANNAHVFQTIDTKKLPDEIGIDNLQVRADVTTPTGDRQHMRIAVTCDVCGKVVSEIYSQCEFQSCQYALCFQCGEDWRKGLFVGNY
ncbi:hypothetical protein K491DRAFT_406708 [Lophiostoma macrostomum CBS 122681]|uniref:Uncharacterized protein n=1 Tax=Lophiostoma macrostomum CBS 122681 TaxID=1314788 RepID=A0A6A6T758_9PLEO|nr:hypothetical protein K491DRAFT_406708 [Lophiostoma macrostomum CBS 122681]